MESDVGSSGLGSLHLLFLKRSLHQILTCVRCGADIALADFLSAFTRK